MNRLLEIDSDCPEYSDDVQLVVWRTPEANLRVDLMLIWPVLLILSIWFTIRASR